MGGFRGRSARARVDVRRGGVGWVGWMMLGAGLLATSPVWGQGVPEVVRPQSQSPTLPPGPSDGNAARPQSENPLADGGGARPVPDSGVIAPPDTGLGSSSVLRPPVAGTMPVIPPPGAPGGDRSVVPK